MGTQATTTEPDFLATIRTACEFKGELTCESGPYRKTPHGFIFSDKEDRSSFQVLFCRGMRKDLKRGGKKVYSLWISGVQLRVLTEEWLKADWVLKRLGAEPDLATGHTTAEPSTAMVPTTTIDVPGQTTEQLTDLATKINAAHVAAERALNDAVSRARECGSLLLEAKNLVGHSEWLPWLDANFQGSRRNAQNYMLVARRWPELEEKTQHVAFLTLRGALKAISKNVKLVALGSEPKQPLSYFDAARNIDKAVTKNFEAVKEESRPLLPDYLRMLADERDDGISDIEDDQIDHAVDEVEASMTDAAKIVETNNAARERAEFQRANIVHWGVFCKSNDLSRQVVAAWLREAIDEFLAGE